MSDSNTTPSADALWDGAEAADGGYREATPDAVAGHRAAVHLVDVREPDEFVGELGHVEGAELVPLGTVEATARNAAWPKEDTLVMVCRSGGRSGRASAALAKLGYGRVINMAGGMLAWNKHGLPVSR